jgi:hypothetical protein
MKQSQQQNGTTRTTVTPMTMTTTTPIDYATQNEEWLAQYRHVQDSLDDDAGDVAFALVTRAGRLGALQCALDGDNDDEDHETTLPSMIRTFLEQTQHEMDCDAASAQQLELLELLAPQAATTTTTKTTTTSQNAASQTTSCTDVDVDAFFEEYPECTRSDWDQVCNNEVSDSEEDSDEEEVRPRKDARSSSRDDSRATIDLISNNPRQPLQQALHQQHQPQPQQHPPAATHARGNSVNPPRPSSVPISNPYQNRPPQQPRPPMEQMAPRNPYQTTNHQKPPPSSSFSYTPATQTVVLLGQSQSGCNKSEAKLWKGLPMTQLLFPSTRCHE